jgi:two-component system, NarL family, nitrate/nitrite response regulator NarL
VASIEIHMRPRLVKEALSSALMRAGFSVFNEPGLRDDDTLVVIDFEDCKDPESLRAHRSRGLKIVVLTSEAHSQELELDGIAPLSGVLTYDLSVDAFVLSLRLICSGERVFPRDLAIGRRPQAKPPGTEPQSEAFRLSPREKEILSHLVAGHSNKGIGRELGIAEATVKVHLKSALRKIRVANRTQAAIWALDHLPNLRIGPKGSV